MPNGACASRPRDSINQRRPLIFIGHARGEKCRDSTAEAWLIAGWKLSS